MRTPFEQQMFNSYRWFNQVVNNPNNQHHRRFKAWGIKIENEFASFRDLAHWVEENLGPAPGPEYKLIRKNRFKGYTRSNLKWGIREEIALEQYRDRKIRYKGKSLNLCKWADLLGLPRSTVYNRHTQGKTKPSELFAPSKRPRKR